MGWLRSINRVTRKWERMAELMASEVMKVLDNMKSNSKKEKEIFYCPVWLEEKAIEYFKGTDIEVITMKPVRLNQ